MSSSNRQVKRLLVVSMVIITLVLSFSPASLAEGKADRATDPQAAQDQGNSGAVVGVVYNDWNQDGGRDEGEPSLAGAVVTLRDMRGESVAQVTTGEDGAYRFEGLRPGGYILVNESARGYSPMGDGKMSVIVRAGEVAETSFGDVLLLLWGEDQSPATDGQLLVVERATR